MLDWSLVDIYEDYIHYNDAIRPGNPNLRIYVTKHSLSSWDNGRWVKMYQLAIL